MVLSRAFPNMLPTGTTSAISAMSLVGTTTMGQGPTICASRLHNLKGRTVKGYVVAGNVCDGRSVGNFTVGPDACNR